MPRVFLDFISRSRPESLRLVLPILAALAAAQICFIQHGWINNDTVLYLEAARLFADGQWKEGVEVFPWPLYSLLIAGVHQITTFSLHLSAQLLSVAFFAATTYFLIGIIILAGGNNLAVSLGALILFSSHYVVGDVMGMLMRDQGFWAFFLAALTYFIKFCSSRYWRDALLWQACIIVATLFRVEGITYLVGLPLLLLLNRETSFGCRLKTLIKVQSVPLLAGIAVLIAFQINQQLQIQDLGRLREIFTWDLFDQLTAEFRQRSQIMADQVLGNFLDDYAAQGLLLTFVFVILSKTLSSTGLINIGLAGFCVFRKNALPEPKTLRILIAAIVLALLNAQFIILKVFVLSSRYIVPLILLCMIFAALGLARLAEEAEISKSRNSRWLVWAILIFMMLGTVKNLLPKQQGYNYQQDSIVWLADKNRAEQAVYYHDARLRYYAGAPFIGTWQNSWERLENEVAQGRASQYKYLVINVDPEDAERLKNLKGQLPEFLEASRHYAPKKKKFVLILENIALK